MDNEEVEVEVEDTLSAALTAAWDDAEGTDDGDDNDRVDSAGTDTSSDSDQPVTNAKPDTDGAGVSGTEQSPDVQPVDSGSLEVAPKGLPPGAREAWKDTPKAVQEAIAQREKDYEAGVMKYAQGAKRAQQMDHTLQPFQQYMSMNGGPGAAIKGLLEAGSSLQMGSPIQKAQVIAGIIQQFGVDINTLDNMLVGGQAPQAMQQQTQMEQMLNQRLAPLQQQLGQYQQRDQYNYQQQQNEAGNDIAQFSSDPANEFYMDVRGRMIEELEMADKNGRELPLKEAYDLACRATPEVWEIMSARQATPVVQGKRRAALSIHGTPSGQAADNPASTLRGTIEDAWENAGRM
jgi:hypothetical protein